MKNVITISREFGSGGHTVGEQIAEKLGYKFYDKEIIEKIASESGLSQKYVNENAEYAPGTNIFSYGFVGRNALGESISDILWQAQCNVIKEIAQEGNCVIVGRCADYILKDKDNVLNVFIHADMDFRIDRIINNYGETNEKPDTSRSRVQRFAVRNFKYGIDFITAPLKRSPQTAEISPKPPPSQTETA